MLSDIIDFDAWKNLAEQDPRGFFLARQALIEQFIADCPGELVDGLWQLQRGIDCMRAEAASPMRAVQAIVGMMCDHLDALQSNVLRLRDEAEIVSYSLRVPRD